MLIRGEHPLLNMRTFGPSQVGRVQEQNHVGPWGLKQTMSCRESGLHRVGHGEMMSRVNGARSGCKADQWGPEWQDIGGSELPGVEGTNSLGPWTYVSAVHLNGAGRLHGMASVEM